MMVFSSIDDYLYGKSSLNFNSFGEIGLIQLPTAKNPTQGNINVTFTRNDIYRIGTLSVSPFSWLTASFFYYRPSDLWWTLDPSTEGLYLDKGFNLKLSKYINASDLHIAIGLNDFAGTGFFSREYFILTKEFNSIEATLGLGWGGFADVHGFKNPLQIFGDNFSIRNSGINSSNYGKGGNVAWDNFFKGKANLIGGLQYRFKKFKGLSLIIENDPFNYISGLSAQSQLGSDISLRSKDSNINFGINYNFGEFASMQLSQIKGNTINLSLTIKANFSEPFFQKKTKAHQLLKSTKGSNASEQFYENLILNINRKNIFLQSAEINERNLKVAVASSTFRDPILVHAILGETVNDVLEVNKINIDTLTTIGINVGHELHQINTPVSQFKDRKNSIIELVSYDTEVNAGEGQRFRTFAFRPTIKYPASFTGMTPALVNHIGDPAKFYYGGIILRLDNEIQFSSRFQLNSEIHQNIVNNFDEKRNFPDSLLPKVRTDIVSYLQESDTYISRMQLDYFFNPYKEVFGKFSAGILENMYAGAGVEFLYKPFEENFSVGMEAYRVKKRAFDRKFDLLDYEINTGHINFNYHLPQWGILGTLSYGKYLAGDEGYTFDISRRLSSGFRTGIFFTLTNVSAEQFGEGSFDKGFYFQIPIDLFLNDYRSGYINFKLRPLTRDGGQKLEAGNDLIGIFHSTSRAEIERDWSSFHD